MIPGIFKNTTEKLNNLDKLKLPIELIDIIKSFAFYEVNTQPYYKIVIKNKENISDKIEKFVYFPGYYSGHWALGCTVVVSSDFPLKHIQFQAVNCIFCGEYKTFSSKMWKKGRINKLKTCHCDFQ